MTPKEKAKELFDKFEEYGWESPTDSKITKWNVCKMCLACVNEILKAGEQPIVTEYFDDKYWQEVKQEIKKL